MGKRQNKSVVDDSWALLLPSPLLLAALVDLEGGLAFLTEDILQSPLCDLRVDKDNFGVKHSSLHAHKEFNLLTKPPVNSLILPHTSKCLARSKSSAIRAICLSRVGLLLLVSGFVFMVFPQVL